jgi:hypothetical protein
MSTRKSFLVIGLMLAIGLAGYSQNLRVGVTAGFDVAKTHITNRALTGVEGTFDPLLAFNVNAYLGYRISETFGVSLEPGFIQKGIVFNDYSVGKFQIRENCVQMPVLAEYNIFNKLFISIGPELSYLINAYYTLKGEVYDDTSWYDNRLELSGVIGLGYRINDHLDIGLRYNHGITYITQLTLTDQDGNEVGVSNEYNQYGQVLVRYRM